MTVQLRRRSFLKATTASAVSLMIGCSEDGQVGSVDDAMGADAATSDITQIADVDGGVELSRLVTWIRVDSDNFVHIAMHKAEMGQGVMTALPLIVAEELDVDVAQVRVEMVGEGDPYSLGGLPMTYGSTSVANAFTPFRKVGAAARAVLMTAAAARWGVSVDAITTQAGQCLGPDNAVLDYSDLVSDAAALEPPEDPPLKDPSDFTLIGTDQRRFQDEAIVSGTAVYGIDATPLGGLYAAIRHAPTQAGVPTGVEALTSDDPGVVKIVALPHAVAVVADSFWTANTVVQSLDITFDTPERERQVTTARMRQDLETGLSEEGVVVEAIGDIALGFEASEATLSGTYHVPHIAHFTMEPVNATAEVTADHCTVWVPSQAPALVRTELVGITGLSLDQITVHPTLIGGGFGRKANTDYAEAAVRVAMAVDGPVTLIWSREEDIRRDRFRPSFSGRFTGGLNADGDLVAWQAANCGDSVLGFGQGDPLSAQGLSSLPYTIPNQENRHVFLPSPIQSGFWRSIGHSQNTFFVESFLDEMAHLAERDPVEFRQALLKEHPRVAQVLSRVAELGQWGAPITPGASQGVALCDDYGSMVAVVCEASVDPETLAVSVHRYTAVVDCGVVIQPDGVKAQIEGGLLFGLSAALHEAITFDEGETQQSNLHDYPILTPAETPEIVVEIVESTEAPGGVGEVSVGAAAPALCNAIFAATGRRCRWLPIRESLPQAS
ncbi:MAG: molybdopterin cofactor-binding domain-containing protein [Myxococcota bacterium]